MQKFIALFDIHFGFENNNGVVKPTHNIKAVRSVMEFYNDFKPDIFILGGDQLNAGPISHWNRGRPKLVENLRLINEYDLLNKEILNVVDASEHATNKLRKIWLTGNHEQWITDHILEHPSLEGLIEPEKYLGLDKRGWECYPQGKILKIGKLHFTHGDTLLGKGGYVNPAEHLMRQTMSNIRCGHLHTYYGTTAYNPLKSDDYRTAIVVPGMCLTNSAYLKDRPSRALVGFLYGYFHNNGNFNDYVVILNQNKFIVEGKEYGV